MSLERLHHHLNNQFNKKNCILGAEELKEVTNQEVILLKSLLLSRKPYFILHIDSLQNDDAELAILAGLMNECKVSNFSLTGYLIGNKTANAFIDALKQNFTLRKFNFGGYSLNGESLRNLGDAIREHHTLLEFCILCHGNISTKDLFYFAMQVAKNTNLINANANGFLISLPDQQSQNMRTFIFDFLKQILNRNLVMKNLASDEERINHYNEFAKKWNQDINDRLTKSNLSIEDINPNDLYMKLRSVLSLKDSCFSFLKANIQNPIIKERLQILPLDLLDELKSSTQLK